MRGDTRLWPSLIALTFVAVYGLSVSDGRSHASAHVDGHRPVSRDRAKTSPVVVAILTTARRETPNSEDIERFERVFGRRSRRISAAARHGIWLSISRDGEILTGDHVVADADVIRVRLLGTETQRTAPRSGRDPVSDSALIRLQEPPGDLPFATLGDSAALQAGDWVMAIGNPYGSVTP